VADYA